MKILRCWQISKTVKNLAYLAFIICCIVAQSLGLSLPEDEESKDWRLGFEKSVKSLEKAVEFYSKNYDKVNLDSIFGLRVCQGALHRALLVSRTHQIDREQIERIGKLHSDVSNIANNGYDKLKTTKSEYFHKFNFLINNEWFFMLPYRFSDKNLISKTNEIVEDSLDERTSDICMIDLVGNDEEGTPMSCVITNRCWQIMTEKSKSGYHLTHQALFMMLAEKQGCTSKIVEKLGSSEELTKHMRYLGSNIYHQMEQAFLQGFSKDDINKDLFVEQIVVCQMLGITECFDTKYLSLMVQWQDESGCWKANEKRQDSDDDAVQDDDDSEETEAHEFIKRRPPSRSLSEEKVLDDGCASHFTGVATGALGIFSFWYLTAHDNNSRDIDISGTMDRQYQSTGIQESYTGIFFSMKWLIIFLIVSTFVYLCRKWTRSRFSRKYTKLII